MLSDPNGVADLVLPMINAGIRKLCLKPRVVGLF